MIVALGLFSSVSPRYSMRLYDKYGIGKRPSIPRNFLRLECRHEIDDTGKKSKDTLTGKFGISEIAKKTRAIMACKIIKISLIIK